MCKCSEKPEDFLRFVWNSRLYTQLNHPRLKVLDPGCINPSDGIDLLDVQYELDGTVYCGPVAVHENASDWHKHLHHFDVDYDSCVLHLVTRADAVICRMDGSVVPTVSMVISDELVNRYNDLLDGREAYRCARTLFRMPEVKRLNILTWLTIERLQRKHDDFLQRYRQGGNNWNEAFYITLFRTMGAGSNREPYEKLARTVSYAQICQVKESVTSVEALLLGGAGLLDVAYPDDYTTLLRQEFDHLRRRFNIVPMRRNAWSTARHNPNNSPLIRIVELAALLASREFMFSRLIQCTTSKEVQWILSVQASPYWNTHYRLGAESQYGVKSFGGMMLNNLCINLVAPMLFTYGKIYSDETFQENAVALLEQIPAENNLYIRNWKASGIEAENAFFSQGLLQLSKEYCEKKQCASCNIGRIVLCSQ